MFLVGIGVLVLYGMGILLHMLEEYFWSVVFYVCGTVLATFFMYLIFRGPAGGP